MSASLFRRAWKVIVDTLDVSAMDIEFKVLSKLPMPPNYQPVPNQCVLTVWNLNQDHRAELLKRNNPKPGGNNTGIRTQIEAGYDGNTSTVFSGDLAQVGSSQDATDWKTTVAGDDGGRCYREGRINAKFSKGTPLATVLQQCAAALNIGSGNVAKFLSDVEIPAYGKTLPHGMTLSGNVADELSRVMNSVGLSWSIQSGVVQVQKKGQPIDIGAITLSPDTGLVDSPEASIDSTVSLGNPQAKSPTKVKPHKPRDTSILRLRSLLIPGMFPGRKIDLQSNEFNGNYYLTECEYTGQSWANNWYVNCVARQYQ